jgi:hypothetical protein
MPKKIYSRLAGLADAIRSCIVAENWQWVGRHRAVVNEIMEYTFPHGSGFDGITSFDTDASSAKKLVFATEFHHMDANGYYAGWTRHKVIVTPTFVFDIDIRVTGENRNNIREHIAETFATWLRSEAEV